MKDKMSILLTTEGTYPFSQGGVSTWCDMLVKELKSVDFSVFSVLMDPYLTQKFTLPSRTKLIKIPLWGTEEPNEHLDRLFSTTYLAKRRTSSDVVKERFLPLFRELVGEILAREKNAFHTADVLVEMYDLFEEYDYKLIFKSEATWETYKDIVAEVVLQPGSGFEEPDVYCLIQSLGWVYRFFNIINTPIPQTTVTHASAAAFCALPCVVSKLKWGTPFLLTEHGVYLREQYLSLSKRGYPSFLNTFLIRMIHTVTHLSYTFADQISPVCEYNTRWEREMATHHQRIEVIYNGVDHNVYSKVVPVTHDQPTVVTVARIDPIKDLVTLLRSADIVRKTIPNVRFRIYGSTSVPEYMEQLQNLLDELELRDTVEFCGHSSNPAEAYASGDVVALTSISEGFPYSIVEAMLAGKPIVSTNVGGIPEALGTSGILVPPMNPEALAEGLVQLLSRPDRGRELGEEAQERALSLFTLRNNIEQYLKAYIKLAVAQDNVEPPPTPEEIPVSGRVGDGDSSQKEPPEDVLQAKQHLYAERAFALIDVGEYEEAYELLSLSVQVHPWSYATPILMAQLSRLAEGLGLRSEAESWMERSYQVSEESALRRQQLFSERAYTLLQFGYNEEAVRQFRYAIHEAPKSVGVPVLCMDLAKTYQEIGQAGLANAELERASVLSEILHEVR